MRKLMNKMRSQFSDPAHAELGQAEHAKQLEGVFDKHKLKGNKDLYDDLFKWKNY